MKHKPSTCEIDCSRRQRIVANGNMTFRCINRECEAFGQAVTDVACNLCPARKGKHVKPCEQEVTEDELEFIGAINNEVGEIIAETPDGSPPPNYPPMSLQVWLYKEALLRWNKAGRPTRSAEEVETIISSHCKHCDWHDPEKQRCKGCGCKVTTSSFAIFNKVKMATEHCPKGVW